MMIKFYYQVQTALQGIRQELSFVHVVMKLRMDSYNEAVLNH